MCTRTLLVAASVVIFCARSGAQVWDNVADFSFIENPHGAWTFGKSPGRPTNVSDFTPFSWCSELAGPGLWFWIPVHGTTPLVAQNVTAAPITFADNPVAPPYTQFLHPGSAGQNAVVRWTSPRATTVTVEARFGGVVIDPDSTTTDAAVLHNGALLFSSPINGVGAGATAFLEIAVGKDDVIDFCVGFGSNGTYNNDSTALHVVITAACTADFDRSGFVDTDDFTAFVLAFEAGADDADFDGTGFVDTDDFTAFVLAFEGGC